MKIERNTISDYIISKDTVLNDYQNMEIFFKAKIEELYNKNNSCCYLYPSKIINQNKYKLSSLANLKNKTGVYIFLNQNSIPVYIGIGGQKIGGGQDLKARISQELRAYVTNKQTTHYSKDSGATLSKNIQEIDSLLNNSIVTPDNSIEKMKVFTVIVIIVGDLNNKYDVLRSRALETICIALFHPQYNK